MIRRETVLAEVLKVALIYFALVFGAGFAFGIVRTLLIAPRLGERLAELLEAPLMLVVIMLAARWVSTAFCGGFGPGKRWAVGLLAVAVVLAAEILVGLFLRDLSLKQIFTDRDPVSALVYYVLLAVFAAMPWLLGTRLQHSAERTSPPRNSI